MNYESGEYEDIDEDGYSWTRGEYTNNWDDSEYEREREEEEREEIVEEYENQENITPPDTGVIFVLKNNKWVKMICNNIKII